jgi:hypothetical protein
MEKRSFKMLQILFSLLDIFATFLLCLRKTAFRARSSSISFSHISVPCMKQHVDSVCNRFYF